MWRLSRDESRIARSSYDVSYLGEKNDRSQQT
jgi:hypothetical protein